MLDMIRSSGLNVDWSSCSFVSGSPYTEKPTVAMVHVIKGVVKEVAMYGKPIERDDHDKTRSIEELRQWAAQWEQPKVINLEAGEKFEISGSEMSTAKTKKPADGKDIGSTKERLTAKEPKEDL
eukprot:SAG31_NODE_6132_length_2156_cov_1.936801_3_plen_124_part_00